MFCDKDDFGQSTFGKDDTMPEKLSLHGSVGENMGGFTKVLNIQHSNICWASITYAKLGIPMNNRTVAQEMDL